MIRTLICGCRTCGCVCAAHSPDRQENLCPRHSAEAIARFIAAEAASLVAIALFIGAAMAWCAILAGLAK